MKWRTYDYCVQRANRPETLRGLNDAATNRAGLARVKSSIPTMPGHPTQPQTVRRTPQGNIELMPKKEILDFKRRRDLNRLPTNSQAGGA
jgi:hypothetical protein